MCANGNICQGQVHINIFYDLIKFLDENTFFLKIFCHKFENIFVIKCKKIEIKKVKF